MKELIKYYNEIDESPITTFRTVLLFGRNSSTFKFALTSALIKQNPKNALSYEEVRDDFLKELFKHYKENPNQWNRGTNSVTEAFDQYSKDGDWNNLLVIAERNIYNNVFDAYHNVGGASIKDNFILFEHDKKSKQLVLTDNLNSVLENPELMQTIENENQSRWKIVEEAWSAGISPNLLVYDEDGNLYSVRDEKQERVNIRSAVNALMPYQHGRCFYCNRPLNIHADKQDEDFPDVDHVYAHSQGNLIRSTFENVNTNGIWNLVIACMKCNRGSDGKFDSPPNPMFGDKLKNRNELFTEEHKHSLRNSILISLGVLNSKQVGSRMIQIELLFSRLNGWKPKHFYF
jgi:5-methylcytosine-specific restriction endonuclease McrA